ncbi:MAG: metal-sensing transcriptional repressor [Spirochaetales bacterium]|nr:metal-sensing transcriptional repressor [Spirochaetales bacterium]
MNELNPARKSALLTLKTARGQLEGVMNMIEEGRYCIDIAKQILSIAALLKKANHAILRQHINSCVRDAIGRNDEKEKLDEVMTILDKYIG